MLFNQCHTKCKQHISDLLFCKELPQNWLSGPLATNQEHVLCSISRCSYIRHIYLCAEMKSPPSYLELINKKSKFFLLVCNILFSSHVPATTYAAEKQYCSSTQISGHVVIGF